MPALQLWEPVAVAPGGCEVENASAEPNGGEQECGQGNGDHPCAPLFESILIFGGIGDAAVSGVSVLKM